MDMDYYQQQATETAVYPGKYTVNGLTYCALGLGEAGEVQNKVKKILRDDNGVITRERRVALVKELGDLLWYVANTAEELGVSLAYVAGLNLQNLAGRAERGTLRGDGDNR